MKLNIMVQIYNPIKERISSQVKLNDIDRLPRAFPHLRQWRDWFPNDLSCLINVNWFLIFFIWRVRIINLFWIRRLNTCLLAILSSKLSYLCDFAHFGLGFFIYWILFIFSCKWSSLLLILLFLLNVDKLMHQASLITVLWKMVHSFHNKHTV